MKYMGSKNRYAKEIISIMTPFIDKLGCYVEPFCGGCNVIDKISDVRRIANDSNRYLIALLKHISIHDMPKPSIHPTEDQYKHVRDHKDSYPDWFVGYVGFNSFGAKFFGGYPRGEGRDYWAEYENNLAKQAMYLGGIEFVCGSYRDLVITEPSVIYCDPPYSNTTGYVVDDMDTMFFYDWCRERAKQGHKVFISEYCMPPDFKCVWEKTVNSSLTRDTGSKKATERLFTL